MRPQNSSKTFKIVAILTILVLLTIALWSIFAEGEFGYITKEDAATVTLWTWAGTGTSTDEGVKGTLSNWFGGQSPVVVVSILETGFLKGDDTFVASDTLHQNFSGAFRIRLKNSGKDMEHSFTLFATLPTENSYKYRSEELAPLLHDEVRIYTLRFDDLAATSSATISVELQGLHKEEIEGDLTDEKIISIIGKNAP